MPSELQLTEEFSTGPDYPMTRLNSENANKMAVYVRPGETFSDVFGSSGREVIASMDNAGDDIAQQNPRHKLTLPSAGVTRNQVPVSIVDPLDGCSRTLVYCDVVALTEVPAHKRGIHMSRMSDCIARLSGGSFQSLQEYASMLAEKIRRGQYGGPTTASVSCVYSYLEQIPGRTPDKDKLSLENIGLKASSQHAQGGERQSAGITLTNITACPCVQQTLKHATLEDVRLLPTLTHSQRCETSFSVENITGSLPVKELLEALDRVLVRTRNTLPREYEALLVHNAHKSPQFMEDVVRQAIMGGYHVLKDLFPESRLRVSSRCMESIHAFDITCELEFDIRNLRDINSCEQQ
ncbi:MAG TPA: GTP cyclohydrolase, FolE2/MptA family [Blastocatellia bacterium]|jgi:GTP cyclohydrolase-4|nr:GTP cyclohydrolase, FolE2/MptA family [Blastocatellia bacterium]